ncbi:DUF2513 domain-containing protein [Pseudomonas sp. PDM14]|uniref:DUF2513 domain-containing protein n=1 Tax=Pseudomonas sp. PDM14 TaxID=2769288 RepID=UPI00177FF4A8|nr:DUF2513 domain-containing protein [Pseudomonas sp. PDM14]MBD9484114.1 DUF2513 domain-containing protein [Pseudomonas sp. PDM14]
MKRDWDLIRALLVKIESLGIGQQFTPHEFDGHSADEVTYHIHLMGQAGLIEWADHKWNGEPVVIAKSLTLAGHDLLDIIRDGEIWVTRKAQLQHQLGAVSYDALTHPQRFELVVQQRGAALKVVPAITG